MRKVASAFLFASLVAFSFAPAALAQGPGRGNSQAVLCRNLAAAEQAALALEDSEFKTNLLATIDEQQAALGCED